jgi:hypothetical protein
VRHYRDNNGFFNFWEKPLFYLALGCFIILFLSQALLLKEIPRRYMSAVDKLEGESVYLENLVAAGEPVTVTDHSPVVNRQTLQREHKTIVVRMLIPARSREVFVLVNGSRVGDFQHGELALTVFEGDYLEIDAQLLNGPARFVLNIHGPGVVAPEDGLLLEGKAQIITIGKVKFSH